MLSSEQIFWIGTIGLCLSLGGLVSLALDWLKRNAQR